MLAAALDGYRARSRAAFEVATYQARLAAALDRWPKDKFLPPLKELIAPAEPEGPQSVDDMLTSFQEMKEAGAPLTITKVS